LAEVRRTSFEDQEEVGVDRSDHVADPDVECA
jgi:hypothetical protein